MSYEMPNKLTLLQFKVFLGVPSFRTFCGTKLFLVNSVVLCATISRSTSLHERISTAITHANLGEQKQFGSYVYFVSILT